MLQSAVARSGSLHRLNDRVPDVSRSRSHWNPKHPVLTKKAATGFFHRSRHTVDRVAVAPSAKPTCASGSVSEVSDEDRMFMRQAIKLAERGLGKTYPNPAVGSVIVQDGQVVGEGFHPKAGMPHAEVYALRGAGNAAKGATAYVTLEPCNHFGRTPPCSRALVDAGVKRVVIGVVDPNPLVGGQGIKTLEAAGIEVELIGGDEEKRCYSMNKDFMDRMSAQSP